MNKEELRQKLLIARQQYINKNSERLERIKPEWNVVQIKYDVNNIKPYIEICDTKVLNDLWWYGRVTVSSAPLSGEVGRRIHYLVRDANNNGFILGIVGLASDLTIPIRDKFIGWTNKDKWTAKRINYLMNIQHCIATPELSNYLTGKLCALSTKSKEVQEYFQNKYGHPLAAMTVTSLYGKSSMYNRLEGFEYLGTTKGFCYSDDTEILTRHGWCLFSDLTKSDEVATLSNDGFIEYQLPTSYQVIPYVGKMYNYASPTNARKYSSVDLMVTPGHNMYVAERHKKEFRLVPAEELNKKLVYTKSYYVKRDADWCGEEREYFSIPNIEKTGHYQHQLSKIRMDDWLNFIGWYVSEGYFSTSYKVAISQSENSPYKQESVDSLRCFNLRICNTIDQSYVCSKQLWEYVKILGKSHSKYIPDELLSLSKRQLLILFTALNKGDGRFQYSNFGSYYTVSKKLADQVQEIALKLGIASYISKHKTRNQYIVNFSCKHTNTYLKPQYVSEIPYDGKVYCVTVQNHVIMVRRNGKSCWCGNSSVLIPLEVKEKMREDFKKTKGKHSEIYYNDDGTVREKYGVVKGYQKLSKYASVQSIENFRGVYIIPLAENYKEFLKQEATELGLTNFKAFDMIVEEWKKRWFLPRLERIQTNEDLRDVV